MSDKPITLDQPAPTYGVFGYEVAAAMATDDQEPVVMVNVMTHEETVHCLLLTPYEASELAIDLTIAANKALGIEVEDPRDE